MLRGLTSYLFASLFVAMAFCSFAQGEQGNAVLKYYNKANPDDVEKFRDVLSLSLDFYVEQQIEVVDDQLVWKKKVSEIKRDLNDIVKSAIKYYNFKELDSFKGFSSDVQNQIELLAKLIFPSSTDFNKKWTESEVNRKKYVYFQSEIDQLKLLLNTEIGKFSNQNLLQYTSEEQVEVSQSLIDSVMSSTVYDAEAPLSAEEIPLSEATLLLLQQTDASTLGGGAEKTTLTPFELQLLEMMKANNVKLDNMQLQMDLLRADQLAIFQKQQGEMNNQLQAQIDDLRGMVIELVKLNNAPDVAYLEDQETGLGSLVVENLPSSISIYFEKNASSISAQYEMALVEVVDIMARNPRLKLLVTGLADQTGNSSVNLELSKKRASAVKLFLSQSGLNADRFITKYYGDLKSNSASASDRKVVLEFLAQ